jgi:uncharacterized protein
MGGETGWRALWKVRAVKFDYAAAHREAAPPARTSWHPAEPEFAHLVNALSLSMPYLEPYLIATMRRVRARITDPEKGRELDLYIGQEAAHFRQHQKFNATLCERYGAAEKIEETFKADYAHFTATKTETFHLAYAEGFEALTLGLALAFVTKRETLFRGADPAVTSMALWHLVEEIEHKTVTYDVFEALDGRWRWRVWGFIRASTHLLGRTRQGYRALLKEDGLWVSLRSRIRLYRALWRLAAVMVPHAVRVMSPWYDPRHVRDPEWAIAWVKRYEREGAAIRHLDTARLAQPEPEMLSA